MALTKVSYSMIEGQSVNVLDYGADATGTVSSSNAFIAAMADGSSVYIPSGTYKIESAITVPLGVCLFGLGGVTINKAFNGNAITLSSLGSITGVNLNGNGATYTGVGILINDGTPGQNSGKQLIQNCRIYDTASYCIEYSGDGVGYASTVQLCELSVYNNAVAAIKWPNTDTLNGNRKILNCECNLGPLINVGGADNGLVDGNICGVSVTAGVCIIFPSSANRKIVFANNRFASNGFNVLIDGYDHTFIGNIFAGGVSFASTTGNISFDLSNICTTVIDSSTNETNQIYIKAVAYTPTWQSDTIQPAIGNGFLTGIFSRSGRNVFVQLNALFGSTTTFGTGAYFFSAPFVSATASSGNTRAVGQVIGVSSGISYVLGCAYIDPNSSEIRIVSNAGTSDWNPTTPVTWKDADSISISIQYVLK